MIWDELTSPQLAKVDKSTPVILPIAATEQHGPHLPLATDRLIAEHFSQQLHESLTENVLILPALAVGCSEHHTDFCGSLTLTHETFGKTIHEILETVASYSFTNLVILNAHGGNLAIGQVILEKFGWRHPDCQVVLLTWWQAASTALFDITESGPGGVGHAGEFETSLMLHIAPHLVDHDAIAPQANLPTYPWAEGDLLRKGSGALYRPFRDMTSNGAIGDSTLASSAKGRQISDTVLKELHAIISSL